MVDEPDMDPWELTDASPQGRARYLAAMRWRDAGDGRTTDELIAEAEAEAADAERAASRAWNRFLDWEQYENDGTDASEDYGVQLEALVYQTRRGLDEAEHRLSLRLAWRNDDWDGLAPSDRNR